MYLRAFVSCEHAVSACTEMYAELALHQMLARVNMLMLCCLPIAVLHVMVSDSLLV